MFLEFASVYFCKEAYGKPASFGTDKRFKVEKKNKRCHNKDGMVIVIMNVRASDKGKYYFGIDKLGADWYETFSIVVGKPVPEPVKPLVEPDFEPATGEEMAWMGSEGAERGGINPEVQKAIMKCQENNSWHLMPSVCL